ncbi:MAG TPA: isocitrate lyase/PEP mutase family protein [Methylomirabilota bacterium]|jgi:2-methylisocitrate lyase-like PEP mutase family enzyme
MANSINGMAERFRARLGQKATIPLPGCYDVLSALISEDAGFEAIFLSGYGVAASFLGNPDIGLTTLSETAQLARNVVDAVNVPVVVDVDDGYGNEENVSRTIYEVESAGVAAIQMEDQISPKRCGHAEGKRVLPVEQYLSKLAAALKARQTPLCIIARTDSTDLDDAIRRARKYLETGADAVIIDGLRSLEIVRRVGRDVPGNKQLNLIFGGKTPILTVDQAQEAGFKILLYSTPALYVAAHALRRFMPALRESRDLGAISEVSLGFDEFQTFIEKSYRERKYLR